ncbi:hypothetical protein CFOL_v3_26393 [Cephalotus follicularis]|uniref:Uncharacterized protein n=1 Tax=Cephalotus follicularis TaxID=3775 RepID=A0A1Q3CS07_CEPFO|nr:hypothetical protein CFOL_v3_26393 [Cephalotus follicularis]
MKQNPRHWHKAYFNTHPKCDIIDKNLTETFNGWILQARTKAIISMLDEMRVAIMRRVRENREYADKWSEEIAPRVMKKLNDNKKESEVVNGVDRHTVILHDKRCSCREWDLKGYPVHM